MKRKLFLILTILLILLISLAGCGASDSKNENHSNVQKTSEYVTENQNETYAPTEIETTEPIETEKMTEEDIGENETSEVADNDDPDTDTSIEWINHTFSYTDPDGYQFEITLKASPWILTTNTETLNKAWAVVGRGNTLPVTFSDWGLKKVDNYQNRKGVGTYPYDRNFLEEMTDMYYSVGQISVKNVTEGWNISESNPRSVKVLINTSLGGSGDAMARILTRIFFGNGVKDEGNQLLLNLDLKSDSWGPVSYIMMAPEAYSPKNPDGKNYEKMLESYLVGLGSEKINMGVIGKDNEYQIKYDEE